MNRLLLSLSCLISVITTSAQVLNDGFYRAKNTVTGRYITVTDDYGRIDAASTSADMGAIQTWKSFENIVSNPGSIVYSEYNASAKGYRLYCQGTDTYKIISNYLSMIKPDDDEPHLWIYAKKSGMVAYLCDELNTGVDSSSVEKYTTDKQVDTRLWDALPLSTTGENYFGMKPTLSYGGAYYLSFMASFPFSLYSSGMNVYYINKIDASLKVAVMKEIGQNKTDIPGATPLIARCSSQNPSDNRLDIHKSALSTPSDNLLKGVYFMKRVGRTERLADENPHTDVVKNDTATMRVLGVLSDGSLGMKVYGGKYMPKNSSYLSVPAGSPKELKLVSAEEYEKMKNVKVASITLSKSSLTLEIGSTHVLTATILPANAANKSVTWSTSNSSVAKVNNGTVTAMGEGDAVITVSANDGSGVSAKCNVHCEKPVVKVSGITLSQTSLNLQLNFSVTLTATVLPSDATNKSVTWSTSNSSVATVNNGTITAVGEGDAVITVTSNDGSGVKSQCNVHCYKPEVKVSGITLSQTSLNLQLNSSVSLTATVLPSDATNKSVTWSTSNSSVAKVNNGTVTAVGEGDAVIMVTANDGSGVKSQCNVHCYKPEVKVSGITLSQTSIELALQSSVMLTAKVQPSDATNQSVTWSSSDTKIATVYNGTVLAVGEGDAVITVTANDDSGVQAQCTVHCFKPVVKVTKIILSDTDIELQVQASAVLTAIVSPDDATDNSVVWSSSDARVATVYNGTVLAVGEGNAVITATANDGSGVYASCNVHCYKPVIKVSAISISNSSLDLAINSTASLSATILPADATDKSVAWSSSDRTIATVSKTGEVRAIGKGDAVIRVTANDGSGVYAECAVHCYTPEVKVTSISFDKSSLRIAVGSEEALKAKVLPVNATSRTLLWSSSDNGIATVSDGIILAVGVGKAKITAQATDGSGVSASCEVECYMPEIKVSKISFDYDMIKMPIDSVAVLMASVLPENATNKTLTWKSSNTSVATVADGVVVAVAPGVAIITVSATDGSGVSAQCVIQCYKKDIKVQSIAVDKQYIRMPVDSVAVVKTTVQPSNASNKILRWETSNELVASVFEGVITAEGEGIAIVTVFATDGSGAYAECEIEVYEPIVSIDDLINDSDRPASIYDLSGRCYTCGIESLKPGIYIINGQKVLVR